MHGRNTVEVRFVVAPCNNLENNTKYTPCYFLFVYIYIFWGATMKLFWICLNFLHRITLVQFHEAKHFQWSLLWNMNTAYWYITICPQVDQEYLHFEFKANLKSSWQSYHKYSSSYLCLSGYTSYNGMRHSHPPSRWHRSTHSSRWPRSTL